MRHYGPFRAAARLTRSIRVLNDLLGLRDCALETSIAYAEQGDLFAPQRRAACLRHELGTCSGPCAGFVTEQAYHDRVAQATALLEGRALAPLDVVVSEMAAASAREEYERAAWWRARFDALTWLLGACARLQATLDALSFVYIDPGAYGDDRAYVIRRATVRAAAPAPHTPLEVEAFRALVEAQLGPEPSGPIPPAAIDETLLILSWFRRHRGALRRTVPLAEWPERVRRA